MFMLLPPYLTLGSPPLNSLYRWSSPPLESPRWSSDHHDVAAKHLLELPRHLRGAASGRGLQSHAPGGERRSRFLGMVGDHRDCCLDQQKISKNYMGIVVIKPTCWFLSLKPFLWFSVSWRFVKMYCVRFWSQQLGKELKFLEEPSGENWTDWASKFGPNSRCDQNVVFWQESNKWDMFLILMVWVLDTAKTGQHWFHWPEVNIISILSLKLAANLWVQGPRLFDFASIWVVGLDLGRFP